MPIMRQVQSSLTASKTILLDLLPSHVLNQMLGMMSNNATAEEMGDDEAELLVEREASAMTVKPSSVSVAKPQTSKVVAVRSMMTMDEFLQANSSSVPSKDLPRVASTDSRTSSSGQASGNLDRWPANTAEAAANKRDAVLCPFLTKIRGESHECVTIFFSDLVGFSSWAKSVPPVMVMATLHDLYTRLDAIITDELPELYKVGVYDLAVQ